jgi:hypothetical protein
MLGIGTQHFVNSISKSISTDTKIHLGEWKTKMKSSRLRLYRHFKEGK